VFLKGRFLFHSPTTLMYSQRRGTGPNAVLPGGALHGATEAVFQIVAERGLGFFYQVLCFVRTQERIPPPGGCDLYATALNQPVVVKPVCPQPIMCAARIASSCSPQLA
jgi:hypothetical protein